MWELHGDKQKCEDYEKVKNLLNNKHLLRIYINIISIYYIFEIYDIVSRSSQIQTIVNVTDLRTFRLAYESRVSEKA